MFKKSFVALIFATCMSVSSSFACNDTACNAPHVVVVAPAPSGKNQHQLINDIWIAAKNTNPWVASGVVASGVFVMLYNSSDTFRHTVRSICGLSDDCPCTTVVVQNQ